MKCSLDSDDIFRNAKCSNSFLSVIRKLFFLYVFTSPELTSYLSVYLSAQSIFIDHNRINSTGLGGTVMRLLSKVSFSTQKSIFYIVFFFRNFSLFVTNIEHISIFVFISVPSAPTLNVTSVDHETISVSVNGSSSTTVNGLVLNETSHSISPSGTFTSTGNVNGLTPGTEFTVSLALAIDTSIANCPESAASLLTGATGSASGCTCKLSPILAYT